MRREGGRRANEVCHLRISTPVKRKVQIKIAMYFFQDSINEMEKVLKHKSPADSGMSAEEEEWGCSLACSRQSLDCPSCRRAERSWWP